MSAALKVPKNSVAPLFLNGRNLEPPKLFLQPGQIEQSGEKGLGQGGDQETDGHSDRVPLLRWENLPKGQPLLLSTALHQSVLYGRVVRCMSTLSKRHMTALKDSQTMRN
jgi:hypothetical protein